MLKYIQNLKNYYYLLTVLVNRNIKKKYKGSYLGILWSLLNPLLQMIVLTLVFSTLFKKQIDNFPLYLITGRLVFEFFSQGTSQAMSSIYSSASLIKKVYIPKYILVLSNVISTFIIFLISLIDLVLVMLFTHAELSIHILLLPVYLLLLLLFVVGVGLIMSTIATFFKDMTYLYNVIVMIIMYLSAIFYPIEIIPDTLRSFLWLNPILQFIIGFRDIIYQAAMPSANNILYCILAATVSLTIGLLVFKNNQDKFVFHI